MRVGVDSYSYHRLLGEIRPGSEDPGERFARGSLDAVAHCRGLGADAISLETCFLAAPGAIDLAELRDAAGPARAGARLGAPRRARLRRDPWCARGPAGLDRLRPADARHGRTARGRVAATAPDDRVHEQIARTVAPLAEAARAATAAGVLLAIENHADLRASELVELLERVGDPVVGICLDTANALRVGDDPVAAAMVLAPWVRMLHLKDCEPPDGSLTGPRSVPYGQGVVPLEAVLEAVRPTDPLTCVELGHLGAGEVDERALVADGVAWLQARR